MSGFGDTAAGRPDASGPSIRLATQGMHKGKGMAVLTSGGDSQGTRTNAEFLYRNVFALSLIGIFY